MPISLKISSFLSKVGAIRMPVFQLIFYSSVGYLGYCFYQDYRYKQLVSQIQVQSQKQKDSVTPLKKISLIIQKISQTQGKRQMKFLFQDLKVCVDKYFIDPYKFNNILDYEIKQLEKSELQKKIWWLQPYISLQKIYHSHYLRSQALNEGTFGLGFWLNCKVEQKNQLLECKNIKSLIKKAVELRSKKCSQFSLDKSGQGVQSKDEEIFQCLKQTLLQVSALQKMAERIKQIQMHQRT